MHTDGELGAARDAFTVDRPPRQHTQNVIDAPMLWGIAYEIVSLLQWWPRRRYRACSAQPYLVYGRCW